MDQKCSVELDCRLFDIPPVFTVEKGKNLNVVESRQHAFEGVST